MWNVKYFADRVVAQNDPVVCKEESASFIKELLILHIAVENVLAILDVRPMLRRLRAASIDHMNGQAAGLAFLPGVTQGESLVLDAFPVFVVGGMKDVTKGSATVQREGLSKSRRISNVGHSGVTLHGRQADVPIDGRHIIVVQTTKLHMDREPRLGIPKKESQNLVRCPAKSLEITVNVLEESIVVAAKASLLAMTKQVGQAFACPDLPAVLVGERGRICLIA